MSYPSPRARIREVFESRPGEIITLHELAEGSGFTERQIRVSISNLRHENKDKGGYPLRVAATEPRADGRPGQPSAIAWVYEGEDSGGAFTRKPSPEDQKREPVWVEVDEDAEPVGGEGYRWILNSAPPTDDETDEETDDEAKGVVFVDDDEAPSTPVPMADWEVELMRQRASIAEVDAGNGHRTFAELATTSAGVVLVEDADGEVYRLVKLVG